MGAQRQTITVRVNKGILWVGSEAYPLRNIARTQGLKITPGLLDTSSGTLIQALVAAVIAAIVIVVGHSAVRTFGIILLAAIVVAVIVWVATRQRRSYFALIIETAGNPRTALVSADRSEVSNLVAWITDAISNPLAEFQVQVSNVHNGDKFMQIGNQNVGRAG
jgi:Flp pilus assembly protein TadB